MVPHPLDSALLRHAKQALREKRTHHLLGVGGVGMSALAAALHTRGVPCSGEDLQESETFLRLRDAGLALHSGSPRGLPGEVATLIYSPAIPADHPSRQEARRRQIPQLSRAAFLGVLSAGQRTLAVAGAHGKTTSTAALAFALRGAGASPEVFVGGSCAGLAWGVYDAGEPRAGQVPWCVCEADESDSGFLHLAPQGILLTNIEADHLDHYGSVAALHRAYRAFLRRLVPGGVLVCCAEDPWALRLAQEAAAELPLRLVRYGRSADHEVQLELRAQETNGMLLEFRHAGGATLLRTSLAGVHNALNLCGAFALGLAMRFPPEGLIRGLTRFQGVARRQEFIGRVGELSIYDDYAHHPTEIRATLEQFFATHSPPRIVVFQPHLYSRTQAFAKDFAEALRPAEEIWLTEIYPARETPLAGVSTQLIADLLRGHPSMHQVPHWRAIVTEAVRGRWPCGVLLTMGAGDITALGPEILQACTTGTTQVPHRTT